MAKIKPVARNMMYQTGTIRSLLQGVYDGDMTFAELAHYGDFGLGTFNAADGEMVALDGCFYRIDAEGQAHAVPGEAKTPFAVVTHFKKGKGFDIQEAVDLASLECLIAKHFESQNIIYAFRIDGLFSEIKLRSEHPQNSNRPLAETIGDLQTTFAYQDIRGTLVGAWFPEHLGSLNVPGFHFHFIDQDRRLGGHVFGLSMVQGHAQVNHLHDFGVHLIHNRIFERTDLAPAGDDEVKAVEEGD